VFRELPPVSDPDYLPALRLRAILLFHPAALVDWSDRRKRRKRRYNQPSPDGSGYDPEHNAPDADARAVQVAYLAHEWAAEQGNESDIADSVA
jgi:hypothetical protein